MQGQGQAVRRPLTPGPVDHTKIAGVTAANASSWQRQ